jgi:hypothetical protein
MRVTFSYVVGSTLRESRSFTPSTAARLPRVGDAVPVEYVLSRPQLARIPSMAYHAYGWVVVWALFFPIIGLALVLPRLWALPAQVSIPQTLALQPQHTPSLTLIFHWRRAPNSNLRRCRPPRLTTCPCAFPPLHDPWPCLD